MLDKSTSVFTFHSSASAEKEYCMFKESTFFNQNAVHKTKKWCNIQASSCFFCELFHDNSSYRYSTLIHARESESHLRSRLLLLASLGVPDRASGCRCFCKGTRKYNTPASNKRQVPFFCLLSFPAHGPSWDGGSWRGPCSWRVVLFGSIFLWMAFMSRTTRVHVKSCSFSWQDFVWFRAVIFATLMFLQKCTPHLGPSEIFFLSNLQGCSWARLLGIRPALLPFKSRNKDRKGTFSSVQKFEQCVGQCCFRISPVLAGSMEFSVGFWQPSSLASAPQVGFMSMTTSPTPEEASPWAIHPAKPMEVHCP